MFILIFSFFISFVYMTLEIKKRTDFSKRFIKTKEIFEIKKDCIYILGIEESKNEFLDEYWEIQSYIKGKSKTLKVYMISEKDYMNSNSMSKFNCFIEKNKIWEVPVILQLQRDGKLKKQTIGEFMQTRKLS